MTDKKNVIELIKKLSHSKYPDSEVYLYGSRARGDAKSDSDWDLLILLDEPNISFELETKIMDDYYELELETGEVIAPLIYSKHDWTTSHTISSLYQNVERESIKLK